jgi:hypothetical protein
MRKLPNWLSSYCELASFSEAPRQFHFWSGVGAIAAALRRKCFIDQEPYFTWVPNFYIIFVAPPGVGTKSTTTRFASKFMKDVPGIHIGPNSVTWQKLLEEMAEAKETVLMPDNKYFEMSCVTFIASELGSFVDTQEFSMIDLLTDLWDGQDAQWKRATKTSGSPEILNPWINIMAGTTPAWLKRPGTQGLIESGFGSRCIWVYAEKKEKLIAYPKYTIAPDWAAELRVQLAHDLEEIALLRGEFLLDPDAIQLGEAWYIDHHNHPNFAGQDIVGYHSRKQGHVHKLAMVLNAARTGDMIITKEDLDLAAFHMREIDEGLPRIFKNIQSTREQAGAVAIADILHNDGPTEKGEFYKKYFFHKLTKKQFEDGIQAAVMANEVASNFDGSKFILSSIVPNGTAKTVLEPPTPKDKAGPALDTNSKTPSDSASPALSDSDSGSGK